MGAQSNIANLRWLVSVDAGGSLSTLQGLDAAAKNVPKNLARSMEEMKDPLRQFEQQLDKLFKAMSRGDFGENVGKKLTAFKARIEDPGLRSLITTNELQERFSNIGTLEEHLRSRFLKGQATPTTGVSSLHDSAEQLKARQALVDAENAKYNQRMLGGMGQAGQQYKQKKDERFVNVAIKARMMNDIDQQARAEEAAAQQRKKEGARKFDRIFNYAAKDQADEDTAKQAAEDKQRRIINHARRYDSEDRAKEQAETDKLIQQQAIFQAKSKAGTRHAYDEQAESQAKARIAFEANQVSQRTERILSTNRLRDDDPFARKLSSMSKEEVERVRSHFTKLAGSSGRYADQLDTISQDLHNRATDSRMGRGSDTRQFRWQAMNLGYGIEDFSVGYQLNGLKGGIRGALNNVTAMAQGLKSPYAAGGAVIGATAAAMILPVVVDYVSELAKGRSLNTLSTGVNLDEFDLARQTQKSAFYEKIYETSEVNRSMLRGSARGNYSSLRGTQDKNRDMLEAAENKAAEAKIQSEMAHKKRQDVFRNLQDNHWQVNEDTEGSWVNTIGEATLNFFSSERATATAALTNARMEAKLADAAWGEASAAAIEARKRMEKLESRKAILRPVKDMDRKFEEELADSMMVSSPEELRERKDRYLTAWRDKVMRLKDVSHAEKLERIAEHEKEVDETFEDDFLSDKEAKERARDRAARYEAGGMRRGLSDELDHVGAVRNRYADNREAIARGNLPIDEEMARHNLNDRAEKQALDRVQNLGLKPVNHGLTSGSTADASLMQQLAGGGGGDSVGVDLLASSQRVEQLMQELVDQKRAQLARPRRSLK